MWEEKVRELKMRVVEEEWIKEEGGVGRKGSNGCPDGEKEGRREGGRRVKERKEGRKDQKKKDGHWLFLFMHVG